jgi:hypothetical protein
LDHVLRSALGWEKSFAVVIHRSARVVLRTAPPRMRRVGLQNPFASGRKMLHLAGCLQT